MDDDAGGHRSQGQVDGQRLRADAVAMTLDGDGEGPGQVEEQVDTVAEAQLRLTTRLLHEPDHVTGETLALQLGRDREVDTHRPGCGVENARAGNVERADGQGEVIAAQALPGDLRAVVGERPVPLSRR